jgi:hypothetical protein
MTIQKSRPLVFEPLTNQDIQKYQQVSKELDKAVHDAMNTKPLSDTLIKLADDSAYAHLEIDPTTYITKNRLDWHEGNVVKYVSRWKVKGGLGDLYKAMDYLKQLIDIHEGASK